MNKENMDKGAMGLAELQVQSETVTVHREVLAPPPYTPYVVDTEAPSRERPVIHQTIIVQQPLKSGPTSYVCPACHTRVTTRVEYMNTRKTHMSAGFICGLTFWCMLCCLAAIPYVVPCCKQSAHYCPNCKTYLGTN
ncbi:hypothetical protein JYU34_018691 [Plutella xylostella]|uniref:LITAF domain-containing protein n=1 Tax=Plutella xylostella TaxID=51655 RepID=A0ABQ7PY67_PLUXY|nr:hypothetical protein JYU34_018691 [Plutella xylostella]